MQKGELTFRNKYELEELLRQFFQQATLWYSEDDDAFAICGPDLEYQGVELESGTRFKINLADTVRGWITEDIEAMRPSPEHCGSLVGRFSSLRNALVDALDAFDETVAQSGLFTEEQMDEIKLPPEWARPTDRTRLLRLRDALLAGVAIIDEVKS